MSDQSTAFVADPTQHPEGYGEQHDPAITDLYGGLYPRQAQQYDPEQIGIQAIPTDQGSIGLPTQPASSPDGKESIWLNAMFSRGRKPDGVRILGFPVENNTPKQLLGRRIGRVTAHILNPGSGVLGSNGVYLCDTQQGAQDIADNPANAINGYPLGVANASTQYYEWECEAPLFVVCVAGGTLLTIADYYWKDIYNNAKAIAKQHGIPAS